MPKYLVTSGSYFQPFTYDELAKPVAQAAEIHRATQDTYDQIGLEAEALRRYIEQEPENSNARKMYDTYMDKLSTLQNNLWTNGYNAQTRRDLAAARVGYASDINRLGTAIQTRQQRSAEYWKTKHDHPDMIMGSDPGLSGLDKYLADDLYGSNYYSYSGHDFMNQVGADAKARANEMLRSPEVQHNPELAGYITRIQRDGFSSVEVQNASAAVRAALAGDASAITELDMPSSILANVLMTHLESTGAAGNVSPEEYNRLVDYGVAGLSQAVGKTDVREMNDKIWDYNKQISLMNHQHALSNSGKQTGTGDEDYAGRPYSLDDISTFVKTKLSDKITDKLNKTFVKPFENPIIAKDGTVISSPVDADNILRGFGRDELMRKYGGIDPDAPDSRNGEVLLGQGKTEVRAVKPSGRGEVAMLASFGVDSTVEPFLIQKKVNGKWETDKQMTKDFNKDITEYGDRIKTWKRDNPGIDIQNLALTGYKRNQLAKLGGISADTPLEILPYVLATEANIGRQTPATLAASTDPYKDTRESFANLIQDSYNRAMSSQSKIRRSDEMAFYPIEGSTISDKGKTLDEIKGKKGNFYVGSTYVYPEDLAQNRVRVTINDKTYAINPAMLGNVMDDRIQALRGPVQAMMSPLTDPGHVLNMTAEEVENWMYAVDHYLGDYFGLMYNDETGSPAFISPYDVVTNPALQENLRRAVTNYMNHVIASGRDEMEHNNYRTRGNTSEKATGYNVGYTGR